MSLLRLFDLERTDEVTFTGQGLQYPWGGLYGGHIVAQALRAAALTVDAAFVPHSLRAYFIRRGINTQHVQYSVDKIRDGRSFCTRRVVASQADGAILNLEASFQVEEATIEQSMAPMPRGVPKPEELEESGWWDFLHRRSVPLKDDEPQTAQAWMRVSDSFGSDQVLERCALAYLSDDLPNDCVITAIPEIKKASDEGRRFSASLDHAVWFHRPVRANEWNLYTMSCVNYGGGRGMTFGYVHSEDGRHLATVAQETLVRIRSDEG
ncbi:MAG: acyl-CoA thioesterase [Actinomycetota bacterium]